jgi:predicted RNA-binding protein (virulence factor B family)
MGTTPVKSRPLLSADRCTHCNNQEHATIRCPIVTSMLAESKKRKMFHYTIHTELCDLKQATVDRLINLYDGALMLYIKGEEKRAFFYFREDRATMKRIAIGSTIDMLLYREEKTRVIASMEHLIVYRIHVK